MEPHGQARGPQKPYPPMPTCPPTVKPSGTQVQSSRLPKNLFGEQVGGSSTWERNPPKHDTLIVEMVYRPLTHSSRAKAVPARRSAVFGFLSL
jgi:hypothetical protein